MTLLDRDRRQRDRRDDRGASAVEYGLLVAAIAAIIVMIVFAVGKFAQASFQTSCDSLDAGEFNTSATCD